MGYIYRKFRNASSLWPHGQGPKRGLVLRGCGRNMQGSRVPNKIWRFSTPGVYKVSCLITLTYINQFPLIPLQMFSSPQLSAPGSARLFCKLLRSKWEERTPNVGWSGDYMRQRVSIPPADFTRADVIINHLAKEREPGIEIIKRTL